VQNIELPRWRDAGPKKKNTGTKKRAQQRKKRKCKRLWDNYQVHCLPCDCTMTKEQLDAAIQCYKLQIERRNRYLKQNCDDVLGYGKKSKKKHEEHLDWVAPPVLPYYLSVFLFFIMKGERKERIPSAVDVALTLLENSTKAYSGAMSGATTFILSFLDWSSSHEGVSPGNKSLSLKLRQVYSAFG
jgi:hypothetical protein